MASDFNALHHAVVAATRGTVRFGTLTRNDVALRIGAWLGLEPKKVYLRAGAVVGARSLGGRRHLAELSAFPSARRPAARARFSRNQGSEVESDDPRESDPQVDESRKQ